MRDQPDAIETAAARWVARLDRAPDDADLARAIDGWCAEHPRHAGALLRARAVWSGIEADAVDDGSAETGPSVSRRRVLAASGGLAVAAAAVGAVLLGTRGDTALATKVGERRIARLDDGSTIAWTIESPRPLPDILVALLAASAL